MRFSLSFFATAILAAQTVPSLDQERAAVEKRLARIEGHDSAKASVRYPFELAKTLNAGKRQWNERDFGIPFVAQPAPYDFARGLRQSEELLKELEAGRDPLWRARGDRARHYWFEQAGEMMPYRQYAPTKWDGRAKLPMVLVLHGSTRDENYYFDRDDGILSKLAEQYGYLVVCPLGYRPNAGWGSELGEKDALNVLALVRQEYPVDDARIYLFGHSMGGAGTWHLGQKYRETWAAIATSAAGTKPAGYPFELLKGLPLMVIVGDQDSKGTVESVRGMAKSAKEAGLNPHYLEVAGATHITIVALAEPKVFEFFAAQRRPAPAAIRDVMKSAAIDAALARTNNVTPLHEMPNYTVSLRVLKGAPQPRAVSNDADQVWFVRGGSGKLILGDNRNYDIGAGDVVSIPRRTPFQVDPGNERFEYVAVRVIPETGPPRPGFGGILEPRRMPAVLKKSVIDATIANSDTNQPLHGGSNFTINYVIYKGKSGPWEAHRGCVDIYFIYAGEATALLGGDISSAKEETPGEIRGDGVTGARTHRIGPGDIVLIPRNGAHHMVPSTEKLGYLLVKVWAE